MKQQRRAIAFALLAVLFWSTAGSAFKISLRYTEPNILVLLSVFFAIIVLTVLNIANGSLKSAFFASKREWLLSALMGFLNPFLYYAILFVAYDRLFAQEAVVLNYLWPVLLVLLSIPVLKQKISLLQVLGVFISFGGVIIIATGGDFSSLEFRDPLGLGLAAGSAIIWASYWLINLKDKRKDLPKLLLNFIFGFIFTLILVGLRKESIITEPEGYLGGLYIGLFEMGITFAVWLTALRLSEDTAKVGNLIFIAPFLSLIWVWIFVGEQIFLSTLWGLILILGGIGIQRMRKARSDSGKE